MVSPQPQLTMSESAPKTSRRAELVTYVVTGLLCAAALMWVYKLWRADLKVPLYYGYGGDLMFESMLAKGMSENGWYLDNPRLGAPGEQDLRDFPMPDDWHMLAIKTAGWLTGSWGAAINVYFLGGFFLAAWTALAVLRHFQMARAPAVLSALLFAFAPFRMYRGEGHLRLSACYGIPLAVLMMLWIMGGEPLTRRRHGRWPLLSRKGAVSVIVCVMLGSSGAYFAFFTIVLLLVAGLYQAAKEGRVRRAGRSAALAAVVLATASANLAPSIVHIWKHGKNQEVAVRYPGEAELYGLKLTELVLPMQDHRVPALARLKAAYDSRQPVTEARAATLGTFATAGFCILVLLLITGYPGLAHWQLLHRLAVLNFAAFIIGTTAGVGSVVATMVSPEIRAYNRISIFIAFFAVMAMAAIFDEIWRRRAGIRIWRWGMTALLVVILGCGLLDQTTAALIPPYEQYRTQYRMDADFGRRAEGWLQHGSMVLELPFASFPEAGYDGVLPYLHSRTLRWSFGAMRGRYWEAWQAHLAKLPVEQILKTAAAAGFAGICIDRSKYADRGSAIAGALAKANLPRLEGGGRFWLYNIEPFSRQWQAEMSPESWARLREAVLHPVVLQWLPQCSVREGDATLSWNWCGSQGAFSLENPAPAARKLTLKASLTGVASGPCTVEVQGLGWMESFQLNGAIPQPVSHALEAPSGKSVIKLQSNCRPLHAPNDPRPLAFRVNNLRAMAEDSFPATDLAWGQGCHALETEENKNWHGCGPAGEVTIRNPGPAREASLRMTLASATAARLLVTGPGFEQAVTAGPAGTEFAQDLVIPQGNSSIHFSRQAAPGGVSADSHQGGFRVGDLRFTDPLVAPTLISK